MRLATWNLWWRYGDWDRREPAIAATLRAVDADVVTLQESWELDGERQVDRLAVSTGHLHRVYVPYDDCRYWQRRASGADARATIGLAVLSRWPVRVLEVLPLPHGDGADNGRIAVGVRIERPDGAVPVVTTHLASSPAASATRVRQVREVAALAHRTQQAVDGGAVVVTGDLNAEPHSDEVRLLSGTLTAPAVAGLTLIDAWRFAEPDDPGWTWRRDNPYLGPGNPDARIDHVLVGTERGGVVHAAGLVGADGVDGVWPSDHAGVRVDLEP